VRIVSRAEWGARPASSSTRLQPDRVGLLVLHHTTGRYAGWETVRQIQAFHQGPTRKWSDVGYNFLVAPDGTVFEGRGWDRVGAHARGRNSESVGVAFIGDGRSPVPVEAQRAIVALAGEAERRFGRLQRVGHRDVGSTVCPGDDLYAWWVGGAFLPAAPPSTPPEPPRASDPLPGVAAPAEPQVSAQRISEAPRTEQAFGGPRAAGTALPRLPKGLRWGSGGLPRIPWLRGGA
jgi:hypothetical protein